ncbi:unnamed protein product [Tuber melanosporum]|uniref:(Perigord truffle) hypothetical protein n=1 Tax=Tuber melanosporum (strain Mel28) TaxID=656061 RepID=D5GEM7_TUBMM|nr:uncharacterized protein GSTUM_00001281001 [Tuber melanosporum]CAZ82970.1 unnamed protein product [Tuber melanosporum]
MLRVIPYPPPPRPMINGDKMSGRHLHQQPRMTSSVSASTPEQVVAPATVSRVYRVATNLFLTRRVPDALMVLQPIIADSVSPRVRCSRTLRIKVWSLYFAILDATAKMGPEEGKKVWGAQEWRRIVSRVRSGAVWNEAIQIYGEEGRIDGDVVNTLVMLLLAHSQDQTVTQKKIEAYLSAAPSLLGSEDDPKAVSQRVKLMELYILHVLPRVGDWEYAREFTQMSPDLDEEQKEAFQATLDALQKDKEETERYSQELEARKEAEWEKEEQAERERQKRELSPSISTRPTPRRQSVQGRAKRSKAGSVRGDSPTEEKMMRKQARTRSEDTRGAISARGGSTNKNTTSLFSTTTALLNRLQSQVHTARGRFMLLRTVIMLAMVVWMTSKRRVREKVRRLLMLAWIKTTRTVGMGMKVTYI